MEIINSKNITYKIANLDQLARGTGARYLECIHAHIPGVLIAKQWRRVLPEKYDILIDHEEVK